MRPHIFIDEDLVEEIATEMDLRAPNRDALTTLAGHLAVWQQSDQSGTPEFVLDLATGVGKTYLMVGAIDYLARFGARNFVVFVPRTAILRKTLDNLTPGHRKSIVDALPVDLTVITSDQLKSPATATAMADPEQVKVYVVTVQTLTGRDSDVRRKAHDFQEELGAGFYKLLQEMDDLVVFADEHHSYYGAAFSDAVRDLEPMCLVGLTATPHAKTPDSQIIFRYPLANAIEDEHVKRPVIVGRGDELTDDRTKLYDGAVLLRAKQQAADRFAEYSGASRRNLLMLVVTEDIAEAEKVEGLLRDPDFFEGAYDGRVLRVDSKQPEEALEALAAIEDEDSPYRIVVSVAMLKEGWDVATVAVICSLRPSVSDLLTEQTLGRGLRLPWGQWVSDPLLNELDVVAHASYEKVLKQARALREERVDWRTFQAAQQAELARQAAEAQTAEAAARAREAMEQLNRLASGRAAAGTSGGQETAAGNEAEGDSSVGSSDDWTMTIVPTEGRINDVTDAAQTDPGPLLPRLSMGNVPIPIIEVVERPDSSYELSDVLAEEPTAFADLGKRFARDPETTLRRTAVIAKTVIGRDGIPVTQVTTAPAETSIQSDASPPPLAEARARLVNAVLASNYATGRVSEEATAEDIVDALIAGAGAHAETIGAYLDQLAGALLREIGRIVGLLTSQTRSTELVGSQPIDWKRQRAEETLDDLTGDFVPRGAYVGWARSLYTQVKFDSRPERTVAVAVDDAADVQFWVRLHRNDLPVTWVGDGHVRDYNPDLLVVESARRTPRGTTRDCWLVEVKSDKDDQAEDVKAKHAAAARWVAKVNAARPEERWNVLRVNETNIKDAKGSWAALKQLGHVAL